MARITGKKARVWVDKQSCRLERYAGIVTTALDTNYYWQGEGK